LKPRGVPSGPIVQYGGEWLKPTRTTRPAPVPENRAAPGDIQNTAPQTMQSNTHPRPSRNREAIIVLIGWI
jgi:hypothetical protein